jgi:Ca2+-binding RTX toxin-like protein
MGGAGNDTITGGTAPTTMTGGIGADRSTLPQISDFATGVTSTRSSI